VGRFLRHGV